MSLGLWDLGTCLTDSNLKNTHVQIKLPHLTTFTFCLKYFHYGHFSCTFSGAFRVCSQNIKATPMFAAARSYKTPIHFSDSGSGSLSVMSVVHTGVHKICAQYWDVWQNWSADLSYGVKSLSRTAIQELMIMHGIIIWTVLSDTA